MNHQKLFSGLARCGAIHTCNPCYSQGREKQISSSRAGRTNLSETLPQKQNMGRHQWLTPVIPATQKAEIRRITV
jgi:hypothetical protein